MGLSVTHNCFFGSYERFNAFRYELGRQIGINLDEYYGYGERATKDLGLIDHNIMPLLEHSDCEGELEVWQSRMVDEGLDEILNNFVDTGDEVQNMYFTMLMLRFRDGCRYAIHRNEVIHFY